MAEEHAEHQWEPYNGVLTREPALTRVREMELGPHTRTCSVCGVITDDTDDCQDLECSPGRHR